MELSKNLQDEIVKVLKSLPTLNSAEGRQAFICSAGLDSELQECISYGGSLTQFVPLLVSTLSGYEKLKDGRYPLVAILDAAKNHVGLDKKEVCETLVRKIL